jgi:hypothetical protein
MALCSYGSGICYRFWLVVCPTDGAGICLSPHDYGWIDFSIDRYTEQLAQRVNMGKDKILRDKVPSVPYSFFCLPFSLLCFSYFLFFSCAAFIDLPE